jgi:hypothetical protein
LHPTSFFFFHFRKNYRRIQMSSFPCPGFCGALCGLHRDCCKVQGQHNITIFILIFIYFNYVMYSTKSENVKIEQQLQFAPSRGIYFSFKNTSYILSTVILKCWYECVTINFLLFCTFFSLSNWFFKK